MSAQSYSASEASIVLAVKGLGRDVYEIEMPDDKALKYDKFGALLAPFYVLSFGGPLRANYGDRSLMGADKDPIKVVVIAQTVAGDADTLRTAHAAMTNLLNGFYPTDSSEMVFGGGNGFSMASNVSRPTLYVKTTYYTYSTNMTTGA